MCLRRETAMSYRKARVTSTYPQIHPAKQGIWLPDIGPWFHAAWKFSLCSLIYWALITRKPNLKLHSKPQQILYHCQCLAQLIIYMVLIHNISSIPHSCLLHPPPQSIPLSGSFNLPGCSGRVCWEGTSLLSKKGRGWGWGWGAHSESSPPVDPEQPGTFRGWKWRHGGWWRKGWWAWWQWHRKVPELTQTCRDQLTAAIHLLREFFSAMIGIKIGYYSFDTVENIKGLFNVKCSYFELLNLFCSVGLQRKELLT